MVINKYTFYFTLELQLTLIIACHTILYAATLRHVSAYVLVHLVGVGSTGSPLASSVGRDC